MQVLHQTHQAQEKLETPPPSFLSPFPTPTPAHPSTPGTRQADCRQSYIEDAQIINVFIVLNVTVITDSYF